MNRRGSHFESSLTGGSVQRLYGPDYNDQERLLHLYLGEAYERLGNYTAAAAEYAKRLPKKHHEINRILFEITSALRVPIIDVEQLFIENAANGIVGYSNFFVDGVHFTPAANKVVAKGITDFILENDLVPHCKNTRLSTNAKGQQKIGPSPNDLPLTTRVFEFPESRVNVS